MDGWIQTHVLRANLLPHIFDFFGYMWLRMDLEKVTFFESDEVQGSFACPGFLGSTNGRSSALCVSKSGTQVPSGQNRRIERIREAHRFVLREASAEARFLTFRASTTLSFSLVASSNVGWVAWVAWVELRTSSVRHGRVGEKFAS